MNCGQEDERGGCTGERDEQGGNGREGEAQRDCAGGNNELRRNEGTGDEKRGNGGGGNKQEENGRWGSGRGEKGGGRDEGGEWEGEGDELRLLCVEMDCDFDEIEFVSSYHESYFSSIAKNSSSRVLFPITISEIREKTRDILKQLDHFQVIFLFFFLLY